MFQVYSWQFGLNIIKVTNKEENLCCSKVKHKAKKSLTDTNKWWTQLEKIKFSTQIYISVIECKYEPNLTCPA